MTEAKRYKADLNVNYQGLKGLRDVVLAVDHDAVVTELAEWQRMRNEAMEVATRNRKEIERLTKELADRDARIAAMWKVLARSDALFEAANAVVAAILKDKP